uniref:F-box domain-containing protein n=1 Tax=Mycena chlorophos TaxID=658473 RepID=A0ABQ0M4Z3_MYCCL|nr:predicted protein [Mycena chlorophos]
MSLIGRLPPEIVAEIFLFAATTPVSAGGTIGADLDWSSTTTRMPRNLSSVCTRWREISRTTPALWRVLGILISASMHSEQPEGIFELLDLHLKLCKPFHLDLRVTMMSSYLGPLAGAPLAFLKSSSHRIGALTVMGPLKAIEHLVDMDSDVFCKLKRLDLRLIELVQMVDTWPEQIAALRTLPELRHVHLNLSGSASFSSFTLDAIFHPHSRWNALRSVEITLYNTKDIIASYASLAHAPNLERLCIEAEEFWDHLSPTNLQPISFQRLNHLILRGHFDNAELVARLFQPFAAPALRVLDVQSFSDAEPIRQFLVRSGGPPIEDLVVDTEFLNGSILAAVLRLLPQLHSLTLRFIEGPNDELLLAMTVQPGSDALMLPHLQHLKIAAVEGSAMNLAILVSMLESRQAQLHHARVSITLPVIGPEVREADPALFERFQTLVDFGMLRLDWNERIDLDQDEDGVLTYSGDLVQHL